MSLGDAYQDDVDRALDASAALAPDPVAPKPRGLWRTAADSLIGAGAKIQASALEVGNVIGPALALSADPSNADALEAVKRAPDFRQNEHGHIAPNSIALSGDPDQFTDHRFLQRRVRVIQLQRVRPS